MGSLAIHMVAINGNDGCESTFSWIRLHNYPFAAIRASLEVLSSLFAISQSTCLPSRVPHGIHFTILLQQFSLSAVFHQCLPQGEDLNNPAKAQEQKLEGTVQSWHPTQESSALPSSLSPFPQVRLSVTITVRYLFQRDVLNPGLGPQALSILALEFLCCYRSVLQFGSRCEEREMIYRKLAVGRGFGLEIPKASCWPCSVSQHWG